MSGNKNKSGEFSPVTRVYVFMGTDLPGLLRLVGGDGEDFIELRIKHRAVDDWLAVVKRYGSEGANEVLFSVGIDFGSCLLGADRMIQAGRWRVDRPWKPED